MNIFSQFCLWYFTAVDGEITPSTLLLALENEDTPLGYAQAFLAASVIPNADLSDLASQIEDVVAQADESPTTLYVRTYHSIIRY